MTLEDINRTIFLYYWGWSGICFVLLIYTSLGEGWRHIRGQRITFTPPWLPRLVGFTMALSGPSTLLIGQTDGMLNGAILISLFFGLPMFLVIGSGVQEFSADVEAGTYYTRRGIAGFAPKKTGRLDQLKGVQTNADIYSTRNYTCSVYIMRPDDNKKSGFLIGVFASSRRATAAAERTSLDLHIPLLPPRT